LARVASRKFIKGKKQMRRQIIVIFLSLFIFVLPAASAADRGALFKVAGHGHTMYLYGTIHVGLPEFYPLEPRIAEAVANARTLALEIDPMTDPAIMSAALFKHGMSGAAHKPLTPKLQQRLDRVLERARIDPAAVAQFKPWLVATLLALAEYSAQGYRPELSVDLHLAKLARKGKANVMELETVESQLMMFNRLTPEEQVQLLEEAVGMIESGKQSKEVRQIVEAWRTADQAALDAIAARAEADTSVSGRFVQKVLLDERNGALADKLVQLLTRENNSVAAMGVLHLIGTNSVPALLRARGITVERVY
jgi:uncharacterized protein YbaP (TraB family)